jgi:hypothetical protein
MGRYFSVRTDLQSFRGVHGITGESGRKRDPQTPAELRDVCRSVTDWLTGPRETMLSATPIGRSILANDDVTRTVMVLWQYLAGIAGQRPYPPYEDGPYVMSRALAAVDRVRVWCEHAMSAVNAEVPPRESIAEAGSLGQASTVEAAGADPVAIAAALGDLDGTLSAQPINRRNVCESFDRVQFATGGRDKPTVQTAIMRNRQLSVTAKSEFLQLVDEYRSSVNVGLAHDEHADPNFVRHFRARLRRVIDLLRPPPTDQYVTLDQAAALVNRAKKTLERHMANGCPQAPAPDVEGGGGKPHEWLWSRLRPWLEEQFRRPLPEHFPRGS